MGLIQMSDAEFQRVLHGWKAPPPLSETFSSDRHGINPFTKQPITIRGRRLPIGPEPVADPDATVGPDLRGLPQITFETHIHAEMLDGLAGLLFGWTEGYAKEEVSGRWAIGPENAAAHFELVPPRVVQAIASLGDEAYDAVADRWAAGFADLITPEKARSSLGAMHAFCRDAIASGRAVYLFGTR